MKRTFTIFRSTHGSIGFLTKSVLSLLVIFFTFHNVYGLNPDSLIMKLRPQISLLTEYDDNYGLLSNSDPAYEGDGMIHLLPRFGFSRNHKSHFYGIGFDSDFRKGMFSAPFQSNLQTAGKVKLKYNNGLEVSLADYFRNQDFDLGLTDLPGISQRQSNNFNSKISYAITDKFKVYGLYDNRWNTYLNWDKRFKRLSNVFGGGLNYNFTKRLILAVDYKNTQDKYSYTNDTTRKRSLDDVNAKLSFPLTKSLGSYVLYTFKKQFSLDIQYRNYTSNRTVGGLVWKGRNRLTLWLEAGYESIVFESVLLKNYNNIVGMAGINLKVTEVIKADFAAGIDGYSNFVFNGDLTYNFSNKTTFKLLAYRKSESNFYSYSPNPYYIAYNYQLHFLTNIKEYMQIKFGGTFQTRDDYSDDFEIPTSGNINNTSKLFMVLNIIPFERFRISLDGSYLVLKSVNGSYNAYNYDTYIGKILMEYSFKKWVNIGAHYQGATRLASNDLYGYDNTRFGIYIKILF